MGIIDIFLKFIKDKSILIIPAKYLGVLSSLSISIKNKLMGIIAKSKQKFINDFFSIYISFFIHFLSLIFQIFSTKYFQYENSKILIFLFAVYAWGSF